MKDQMKTIQIIIFKGHSNKRRLNEQTNEKISSLTLSLLLNSYCRCWGVACKWQNGRHICVLKSSCVNWINTENLLWQWTLEIIFHLWHWNFLSRYLSANFYRHFLLHPLRLVCPVTETWPGNFEGSKISPNGEMAAS